MPPPAPAARSGTRPKEKAASFTRWPPTSSSSGARAITSCSPCEADGWQHLYAVSAKGGAATLLTPGEFEVEHAVFAEDRSTLTFSSNQGDIDRRHVWQVAADGAPNLRQLTNGEGIEVSPAITASGMVAVLHSDPRIPMHPSVVSAKGELRDLAPELVPRDFPAAKLVAPQQVIFSAADGMKIHGQLFLPANAADGRKHPALVFFHGGSRREMLLGWHYMDYYSNAYAMNQYLASLGYIVLSANYRSGIGYGLDFREALNYGASGASEFNDVQGAGLYLRSRTDVDPARIGAWGGSYGGYLTALALARSSDMFAAGVDFHGVHDWNLQSATPADAETARLAFESSPLASVKTWRSPVLLIQGDDDRNVPFASTVKMAAALRAQGVEYEEHIFPDEIHGFLLHRSWGYGVHADRGLLQPALQPDPAQIAPSGKLEGNDMPSITRRKSVNVNIGGVLVGSSAPVVVQSMTNTDTADVESTVQQIASLARAGSEMVRITVNNDEAAKAVPYIVDEIHAKGWKTPIIGDFHYNGHLLLRKYPECARALSKYRINPGNVSIGRKDDDNFRTMVEVAVEFQKPVRIGVNWGSLDQALLTRMMDDNSEAARSAATRAT